MFDHLPENEFNELFQKASETKTFEYNPDAWADVERRLLKRKRRRFFIFWLFGAGIVALISLGFWQIESFGLNNTIDSIKTSSTNTEDEPPAQVIIELAKENSSANNSSEEKNAFKDPTEERVGTIHEQDLRRSDQLATGANIENQTQQIEQFVDQSSESNSEYQYQRQALEKSLPISNPIGELDNTSLLSIAENNLTAAPSIGNTEEITEATAAEAQTAPRQGSAEVFYIPSLLSHSLPVSYDTLSISSDRIVLVNHDHKPTPLFVVDLFVARERSTANTSYYKYPDTKFGLKLNYAVTDKLSAAIGLGYKQDYYRAGAGAYKPLKGFWTDGIAPSYTRASCQMLDIPVGINYHFSGISNNSFVVSGGVSSVFMLREDYKFGYPEDGKEHIETWSGRNANKHLFNDVYFSFGYQKKISKHMALKFDPYIQLPIKGIGHGNLKLYTLGTKLSIQFLAYRK